MKICLILIPLFSTLIGWLSIMYFSIFYFGGFSRFWQVAIQGVIIQKLQELAQSHSLASTIHRLDLEGEVSP